MTLPSGEILGVGTDAAYEPRLQIAEKKKLRDSVRDWDKKMGDNVVTSDEHQSLSTMRSGSSARAPIQGSSGGMRRK